jgi:Mg-chelatase subunit ChlI
VIMNAWDVYGRQEITEEDIRREIGDSMLHRCRQARGRAAPGPHAA